MIGKQIEHLRIGLGLTQDEFAAQSGLSKYTIWNYENNKSNPTPRNIEKIQTAFNVDLSTVELELKYRSLN